MPRKPKAKCASPGASRQASTKAACRPRVVAQQTPKPNVAPSAPTLDKLEHPSLIERSQPPGAGKRDDYIARLAALPPDATAEECEAAIEEVSGFALKIPFKEGRVRARVLSLVLVEDGRSHTEIEWVITQRYYHGHPSETPTKIIKGKAGKPINTEARKRFDAMTPEERAVVASRF